MKKNSPPSPAQVAFLLLDFPSYTLYELIGVQVHLYVILATLRLRRSQIDLHVGWSEAGAKLELFRTPLSWSHKRGEVSSCKLKELLSEVFWFSFGCGWFCFLLLAIPMFGSVFGWKGLETIWPRQQATKIMSVTHQVPPQCDRNDTGGKRRISTSRGASRPPAFWTQTPGVSGESITRDWRSKESISWSINKKNVLLWTKHTRRNKYLQFAFTLASQHHTLPPGLMCLQVQKQVLLGIDEVALLYLAFSRRWPSLGL